MKTGCGDSPDQDAFGDSSVDDEEDDEGCDGSGIRFPAGPTCAMYDLPTGWVFVERCDYCERYPDDLAAAEMLCEEAVWVRCKAGGFHAVGRPAAADLVEIMANEGGYFRDESQNAIQAP